MEEHSPQKRSALPAMSGPLKESPPDFVRRHTVRWHEIDASGTAGLAALLRIMEETEYAFLRSRGLSVVTDDPRGAIGFPRVAAEVQIDEPARFEDDLEISLFVEVNDGVSIGYRFEIQGRCGEPVATGRFRIACCRFPRDGVPKAILVPEAFRNLPGGGAGEQNSAG